MDALPDRVAPFDSHRDDAAIRLFSGGTAATGLWAFGIFGIYFFTRVSAEQHKTPPDRVTTLAPIRRQLAAA